jgi:hypothetical protein
MGKDRYMASPSAVPMVMVRPNFTVHRFDSSVCVLPQFHYRSMLSRGCHSGCRFCVMYNCDTHPYDNETKCVTDWRCTQEIITSFIIV